MSNPFREATRSPSAAKVADDVCVTLSNGERFLALEFTDAEEAEQFEEGCQLLLQHVKYE